MSEEAGEEERPRPRQEEGAFPPSDTVTLTLRDRAWPS